MNALGSWLASPQWSLLVLLYTGHTVADFILLNRAGIGGNGNLHVVLRDTSLVITSHAAFLLPFMSQYRPDLFTALTLLLALGVTHVVIDIGHRHLLGRREDSSLSLFVADQVAHALVILGVWRAWRTWLDPRDVLQTFSDPTLLTVSGLILSAYVLNGRGGAILIGLFLKRFPVPAESGGSSSAGDVEGMGRVIGILERMLLLSLILLGQWQAVGWIFAGKTVARFRELNDRVFSEYYIIGTLSSLLFAAATGSAVRLAVLGSL